MKVSDLCKSYFSGFQEVSNFRKNDTITNALAVLKILSYFTVVIPLAFAAAYGADSLCGRVSKKQDLSSHDKSIHDKGKKTILKSDKPASILEHKQVNPKESIKAFDQKILQSAPYQHTYSRNKAPYQEALSKEINRFNEFLKKSSAGSHDVVYVCIGPGGELDQVWPGFIFESLEKGQTIKTIVFEHLHKDMTFRSPKKDFYYQMRALYHTFYKALPGQPQEEVSFLGDLEKNYEFHQFLCGYPDMTSSVAKTNPELYRLISNVYWPTSEQIAEARFAFEEYIRKELKAGKTVILGEHRGGLDEDNIKFYNELANQFPGKVHFLWAWGNCNLMTSIPLTIEDCNPEKKEKPWVHYKNLGKCLIR